MFKILNIIGTRPEVIKMAPVIRAIKSHAVNSNSETVETLVCTTGQHQGVMNSALELFHIVPDFQLNVMRANQSLGDLTARLLEQLQTVVQRVQPDVILAQGDTTSVLAASMIAFYERIHFGHVEAGLRTQDLAKPFPEEMNRRVADLTAKYLFAPTEQCRTHLLLEGCSAERIHVTGNTVIDAVQQIENLPFDWNDGPLKGIPQEKRLVLVTTHRRENLGDPLIRICRAIQELVDRFEFQDVHFILPLHPNPNVRDVIQKELNQSEGISLIEPLDYLSLIHLLKRCELVLTDSGGLQEEAPCFHVPVLVLRDSTERPEGVAAGFAELVGTDTTEIVNKAAQFLSDLSLKSKLIQLPNPYGDGQAGNRIASILFDTLFR